MIRVHRLHSVLLPDGRVLIGNLRLVGDRLVLSTVPYRDDHAVDWRRFRLRSATPRRGRLVLRTLTPLKVEAHSGPEAARVMIYDARAMRRRKQLTLFYEYEGTRGLLHVTRDRPVRRQLAAMTVFLHDDGLLPAYVAHYRRLGVDEFFTYYNGRVTPAVTRRVRSLLRGLRVRVNLVELDLPYWDHRGPLTAHCAQVIAIQDFLYWAQAFAAFVVFADFDEYIYLHTPFAPRPGASYVIANRFALTGCPDHAAMRQRLSETIRVSRATEGTTRTKWLADPRTVQLGGVHGPAIYRVPPTWLDPDAAMFHAHCIDFPAKDRRSEFGMDRRDLDDLTLARSAAFDLRR